MSSIGPHHLKPSSNAYCASTGCLVNSIFMGRGAAGQHESSVAKFDFWAKSKNLVSGIQRLTDSQMLEKATLRQNSHAPREHHDA
jgi:hypothetical protein